MRKPALYVALLSLLLLALPVLTQGGITLCVQRADTALTPDLPSAVVAALDVSGSMSGQIFIDARSPTPISISEPVPPPSDPDLRLLLMAVLGVVGLLMAVTMVGMLLYDWAVVRLFDQQVQAVPSVWWWLIPFALLVLTVFFVIPHLMPIDVSWNPPADIVVDTALGPDQLNATANLSGDFVYEPPPGTVLRAAGQQPLQVTFHGEPLPSPWLGLAIVSGLLTLVTAMVLAYRAWWGWYYVDRQPCQEDAKDEPEMATVPADGKRIQRAEERWEDRDERPKREPRAWWSAVALAFVILGLAGLLWYYLSQPRTAVAQQTINVLPTGKSNLSWDKIADVTYPFKLTETQLNAVAAVPGEIHYDPGFGEPLDAGDGQPIKATFTPDSSDYSSESLINYINVLKGTPTLTWTDEIEIACGSRLGPDQLNPKAHGPEKEVEGEWTFSLGEDTFGQDAGPIPAAGSHKLVASFHPTDSANWNDASISTTLRVPRTTPTLNWPQPAPITYQEGLELGAGQLNAQANVSGTYSYTLDATTWLYPGTHRLGLTFTPEDSVCYDSVTGSVNLVVLPGDPGLRCSDPADIVVGTVLGPDQLNAQADVDGMFTYTPRAGTMLGVGDGQRLMVEFEPESKNYSAASCIMKINVKPGGDTWHEAQFLKNGDFEGGFRVTAPATAVGKYWRHFNNGDYHFGYYDDPWDKVWYNANHSQLIEIGSATYDPGDRPNRLSGISQTVRGLIPGQRYTLTLHGIIRVSEGDPNTDNLSYVVQWGVARGASAAWGDVKTWNIVPWTHVFPYLTAGPVQSYTTTFTAESDTLTLFLRLLNKPGEGNTELNLNLDGLSLIGPTTDRSLTLASK